MSDLSERLRIHGKQRIREIGWQECPHIAVEAADKIEALEAALTPIRSGGDWGKWLAWIISGAPDRATGVAAAKRIVEIQAAADAALKQEGRDEWLR